MSLVDFQIQIHLRYGQAYLPSKEGTFG